MNSKSFIKSKQDKNEMVLFDIVSDFDTSESCYYKDLSVDNLK